MECGGLGPGDLKSGSLAARGKNENGAGRNVGARHAVPADSARRGLENGRGICQPLSILDDHSRRGDAFASLTMLGICAIAITLLGRVDWVVGLYGRPRWVSCLGNGLV